MTTKRELPVLSRNDLTRVRGGFLLPAVQKIRDAAHSMNAIDTHVKFDGISGEATE